MRCTKWISLLAFLALMCALNLPSIAEDEIVSLPVDEVVDELGITELEGNIIFDNDNSNDSAQEVSASSDFVIEDGILLQYTGLANNVVIPTGVTGIGYEAFSHDANLESVIIPDSVTSIGSAAFHSCSSLKSITIPNSVTEIGYNAFTSCDSLKSIQLSENLSSIEYSTFHSCNSLESITIPGSVSSIANNAFCFCTGLKTVTINNGVTSIEDSFSYCSSLESVSIPVSVTKISRTAFNDCPDFIIKGQVGSYAEQYAKSLGITFNAPILSIDKDAYNDYDNSVILHISTKKTLHATQKPSDLSTTLVWSSSDPSIATVDQSGNVTGISTGVCTITVATKDGKGKPDKIPVTVPEPTSIELSSYDTMRMTAGEAEWLYAYHYTPYMYGEEPFPVKWKSSDDSIVSIESSGIDSEYYDKCYIKAKKPGNATITAYTDDTGSSSLNIMVDVRRPDSISINEEAPTEFFPGDTFAFTTRILPDNAVTTLTWYSSDPSIANVDQNGLVTAIAPGEATISVVTDNDELSYLTVFVTEDKKPDPNPEKIKLSKSKATLGAKDKLTLTATLIPLDTQTTLTWTSSNPKVAKVDKNGKITARKKGTATITATADNGVSAKIKVTVKPAPKKVTLYKGKKALAKSETLKLKKGKTLKLKAKLPTGTASTLTWKSSKPKVVKVDKNGKLTALKPGTAIITVKTHNGKRATVKVKVNK